MDWNSRSEEAIAQGVCHTDAECKRGYAELDADKKAAAVAFLRVKLHASMPEIREAIKNDPENWIGPYHMYWGMNVRNALRDAGMGEKFFPVHNLDDIYHLLVEDAAREEDGGNEVCEPKKSWLWRLKKWVLRAG